MLEGGKTGEQCGLLAAEKAVGREGHGHEVLCCLGPVGGAAQLDAVTTTNVAWACQAERATTE
jgi:hypothetical protein